MAIRPIRIYDKILATKWLAIKRYILTQPNVVEFNGILRINDVCYLAKNSNKFRLKSHLDWAWYTPKTLAQAIDSNTLDSYYEIMLNDVHSDPNVWKDGDFEMSLKSFYAAREGRASLI